MDDDEFRDEIDTLHARIDGWRAIATVMVEALGDMRPGLKIEIMRGLAGFERALRQTNERDAVLKEMRDVRESVEALGMHAGSAATR